MPRSSRVLVRVAAGVVVLVLLATALAWLGRYRVTHDGRAWQLELDDAKDRTVVSGEIYRFTWRSARPSGWTVALLDSADGSVRHEWAHPSLARPSVTADGGMVFADRTVTPASTQVVTALSLYSRDDQQVWRTRIEHSTEEVLYVTAAAQDAVDVVICANHGEVPIPETTMLDEETAGSCRLVTIDETGRAHEPRRVYASTSGSPDGLVPSTARWDALAGRGLPLATLVMPDLTSIEVHSPASGEPMASIPHTVSDHTSDGVLTPYRLLTVDAVEAGCVLRGYDLRPGGTEWTTPIDCGRGTILGLALTTDPAGTAYLGAVDAVSGRLRLFAVDQDAPVVHELGGDEIVDLPVRSATAVRNAVTERVAGDYALDVTDGTLTATQAFGDAPPVVVDLAGRDHRVLSAQGTLAAVATRRPDLSWSIRNNPLIDAPEEVRIIDLSTGDIAGSALFSAPIAHARMLDGGPALVRTVDDRVVAVTG